MHITPSSDRGKAVEHSFDHRACLFLTDGSPKEQQSVAGFGGWRDAAVPVWLGKQLWGLICPTPPQKRGWNSICSWPTVLPLAETAAQALLKKPHWGNVPASALLSEKHAGCATPRVLVLFSQIQFHSAIYHGGHISCNESAEKGRGKEISARFAVEHNWIRPWVMLLSACVW